MEKLRKAERDLLEISVKYSAPTSEQLTDRVRCQDAPSPEHNVVKEGTGDLSAIQEIINRLEGKPSQKIVGPDDGPVRVEYRTIEEVRMFLLERGIDSLRVPPPQLKLVSKD